jgi:hypothetical protein
MTTLYHPTTPSAALPYSVFAGEDVCAAAGLAVYGTGPHPQFDENVWDFTGVIGLPRYLARHARILSFAEILNPRWRALAKEFIFARLAPDHPAVRELAHAYRTPVLMATVNGRLIRLTGWLNWLTEQGVDSLGDVTQQHCAAYLELRKKVRDKHGVVIRDSSPGYRMEVVAVIQELGYYTELFSADGYVPSFRPWGRRTAYSVAGIVRLAGNKTPPLSNDVFQPLVAAALYVVEVLAPHVIELQQQLQEMVPNRPGRNGKRPGWKVEVGQAIDRHVQEGEQFDVALDHVVSQRLADGWAPDDPLLRVNLISLAHETGRHAFYSTWLPALRGRLEEAVRDVGMAKRWGRAAALVERADGRGSVPWTLPMNTTEARLQLSRARTACVIALAALTGMRKSELAELTHDCRQPPEQLGEGRLRYRLKGKVIKGRGLGGEHDQWVTIKQAYDTAGVAASLADPVKNSGHLFKSLSFYTPYEWFLTWVNGPEGRRLGLAPIPEEPVSLRMLRRSLAVEMAPARWSACRQDSPQAHLRGHHRGLCQPPRWSPVGAIGRVRLRGARGQDAHRPRCLPRLPERHPACRARRRRPPGLLRVRRRTVGFVRGAEHQAQRPGGDEPARQAGKGSASGAGELLLVPRSVQGAVPQARGGPCPWGDGTLDRDVRFGALSSSHPPCRAPLGVGGQRGEQEGLHRHHRACAADGEGPAVCGTHPR